MTATTNRWHQPRPAAITPAPAETLTISQYEALGNDILIAVQQAQGLTFDYRDPKGDKAARSYLYRLRQLKGRIEAARKDAKVYALEYGRQVDSRAKDLTKQVAGLIAPHQEALDQIAQEEAARVAQHQAVIDRIFNLRRLDILDDPFHVETLEANLAQAQAVTIDDTLEEFQDRAAAELDVTLANLAESIQRAHEVQAERLEAQRLEAERLEAERQEIQRQTVEQERARAARAAQEHEARTSAALVAAEHARAEQARRAAAAEARQAEMEAQAAAREREQAEAAERAVKAAAECRQALIAQLTRALERLCPSEAAEAIAEAIVYSTLHPAIEVNWEKVQP